MTFDPRGSYVLTFISNSYSQTPSVIACSTNYKYCCEFSPADVVKEQQLCSVIDRERDGMYLMRGDFKYHE